MTRETLAATPLPRTLVLTRSGGYCVYRSAPSWVGDRMEYAHFATANDALPANEIAEIIRNETARGATIVDDRP